MKGEKAKFLTDLVIYLKKKTLRDIPSTFALTEANMNTLIKTKYRVQVLSITLSTQHAKWLQAVVDVRRTTFCV